MKLKIVLKFFSQGIFKKLTFERECCSSCLQTWRKDHSQGLEENFWNSGCPSIGSSLSQKQKNCTLRRGYLSFNSKELFQAPVRGSPVVYLALSCPSCMLCPCIYRQKSWKNSLQVHQNCLVGCLGTDSSFPLVFQAVTLQRLCSCCCLFLALLSYLLPLLKPPSWALLRLVSTAWHRLSLRRPSRSAHQNWPLVPLSGTLG